MKRKEFLKRSTILAAGAMAAPLVSCQSGSEKLNTQDLSQVKPTTNWAGNYTYKSKTIYKPDSLSELQNLMNETGLTKALGSQHCFNDIADTKDFHLSTSKLNKLLKIDKSNGTVTVESGTRYGEFCQQIHREGFALHNLA